MNLIRLRGLLGIFSILLLFSFAFAEGTRTWEQSKFEELIKGTTKGVAVRSTGASNWLRLSQRCLRLRRLISGRSRPIARAICMPPQVLRRASIELHLTASPL